MIRIDPFPPLKSDPRYPIGWRGCGSSAPDWVRDNFGTLEAILLVVPTRQIWNDQVWSTTVVQNVLC